MLVHVALLLTSGVFAADLTILNEALAPTGVKISKDGTLDKGNLVESRLPNGRILFHRPNKPGATKSGKDYYNDDWWDADVSKGKDGALNSIRATRYEKGGLPTDEFTATLSHGKITTITSCRHPGQKSCVTATPSSCARVKTLGEKHKFFAKEREQCGQTLNNLGWIYDAEAIAAARSDLSESTAYATSPLAGVGTVFQAFDNLKEVCDKYASALGTSTAGAGSRPADSAR